ncbi:MAG TPA: hypothetical protein PLZ68_06805 [Ferruginibacter sp.]|nr:hypothetical protein [Ferruginibacter sp.]
MKQESPPIRSFIRDYKLEKPGGIICFTASVHFQSERNWFKFISLVHIITISFKHLDVIYLLNPEIDAKKIKTMFTNNHLFHYTRTRRFQITGKSKTLGEYIINIIPINTYCGTTAMAELKAKIHN